MSNLICLLCFCVVPEDCTRDYLIAINQNTMGWFCGRWNMTDIEFKATSQMDLYRKVAGAILREEVYDNRKFINHKTILIKAPKEEIDEILIKKFERAKFIRSRDGYLEYEWITSPTEQDLIKTLITKFKDVKPGVRY